MKFAGSLGVKGPLWTANEQVVNTDINFVNEATYQNFIDTMASLIMADGMAASFPDTIVGEGLYIEWTAGMSATLYAGMALSFTGKYLTAGVWGFTADAGSVFGVVVPDDVAISVSVGDASDRYDTIEIRPVRNEYDSQTRWFQDPVTGAQTQSLVATKVNFGYEVQVLEGTPGSGVAPDHTSGWIKIAEVYVPANATALTQDCIRIAMETNSDWTAQTTATIRKRFDYRSLTGTPGYNRGHINGSIEIRSSNLQIMPGTYEVYDGTLVNKSAAETVSSFFGGLFNGGWHYICMNNEGTILGVIAKGYTIGKTYSIQSITGDNTITVTGISGGVQPAAGMIAVLRSTTNPTSEGYFRITSVSGSPVTSVVIDGTTTNQADPAGEMIVYYPMSTFHFGTSGNRVDIAAGSSVSMYTPSPTDSLLSYNFDDAAFYNLTRNGYYLSFNYGNDLRGYRIIGVAYRTSGGAWSMCIPYKSGRNKNDNVIQRLDNTSYSTTQTAGRTFYGLTAAKYSKLWGNDYIITDDSTNGFRITALEPLDIDMTTSLKVTLRAEFGDVSSTEIGLYNGSALVDSVYEYQTYLGIYANGVDVRACKLAYHGRMMAGDYMRTTVISAVNLYAATVCFVPNCRMSK